MQMIRILLENIVEPSRRGGKVMNQELYDTIIICGGPVGAGAAIYAARKKLRTLLLTEDFGGQSVASSGIENWIGEEKIAGTEFAKKI
jgi:alkyl hydroperoxide reductase subunit F